MCALSDVLLISLGVAGLGRWVQAQPALLEICAGAARLLLGYGLMAARRALSPHTLAVQGRRWAICAPRWPPASPSPT